jgi:uracil-DNA glycosylase
MSTAIPQLIADLTALPAPRDTVNMYATDGPPGNAVRRANLALALEQALARGPDLLLIGEAPGYHGARRTGVPFTSERLLLEGIAPLGQFGAGRGFALATDDGRVSAEQTATIVYRELAALGRLAAGWNACPLHPHRPGADQSNRPPRRAELDLGLPLLARFLALFPGLPVAAMGNVAAAALAQLGVDYVKLRHPAQGGARQFAVGLRAMMAGR